MHRDVSLTFELRQHDFSYPFYRVKRNAIPELLPKGVTGRGAEIEDAETFLTPDVAYTDAPVDET